MVFLAFGRGLVLWAFGVIRQHFMLAAHAAHMHTQSSLLGDTINFMQAS